MARVRASRRAPKRPLLLLAALLAMGATCEVLDIGPPLELPLGALDEGQGTVVVQPYTGHLSADWRIEILGDGEHDVTLTAQASTSGEIDDDACTTLRNEAARRIRLEAIVPSDPDDRARTDLAVVRELNTPLLLPPAPTAGPDERLAFRIQIPRTSDYHLTVLGADVEVRTRFGTIVNPSLDQPAGNRCAEGGRTLGYTLEQGPALVSIAGTSEDADAALLLLRETCARTRLVPRTCPGSAGPVRRTTLEGLHAGAPRTGTLGPDALGIGDRLIVAARCTPEPCDGLLILTPIVQPLECLTGGDCPGSEACSPQGYCVAEPATGGCSASGPSRPDALPLGLLLGALAMLRARRHAPVRRGLLPRRRGSTRRRWVAAATVPCAFLAWSPQAHADTRTEVYVQAGGGTFLHTGAMRQDVAPGLGLRLMQGIQFGYVGLYADIRREFAITRQEPPPDERGLQRSRLGFGLRGSWRMGDAAVFAGAEYWRITTLSNPLTPTVGADSTVHALGGHVAGRWMITGPLYVEGQTGLSRAVSRSGGNPTVDVLLSVGVRGRLGESR